MRALPANRIFFALLTACAACSAGGSSPSDLQDGGAPDGGADGGGYSGGGMNGLHVANGVIVNGLGETVHFHGADHDGTEYMCSQGYGFFDGPSNLSDAGSASQATTSLQGMIDVMRSWNLNIVRVPMNEDCWLGINGVKAQYAGQNYISAIEQYVNLLTSSGMAVILDLHSSAPGSTLANTTQASMADSDHSIAFWTQVAGTFKDNSAVIFDLFNEPFIGSWSCWVSGGCSIGNGGTAAGMAQMLQAVRDAGAHNVVILGGLSYSCIFDQWVSSVQGMTSLPAPLNGLSIDNVAASWHIYPFNGPAGCPNCNSPQTTATNAHIDSVIAAGFPVIIGETAVVVDSNYTDAQISDVENWWTGILDWMDSQNQGYVAWTWQTDEYNLVTNYATGAPSQDYGATYQQYLTKF